MLDHIDSSLCAIQLLSLIELAYLRISVFSMFPIWEAMWFPIVTELWILQHSVVSLVDWVKENPPPKKHMMESCFSGLAFSSLCSGIKQKCDQTKPPTMSIYKAHALYWSFVCCLCRTSKPCLCLCIFVCDWVWVLVSVCLNRRERKKMKGAGWSSAVLVLDGWWGGRCQKASSDSKEEAVNSFFWKSIRPKNKHRRASNPGLALV